MKIRYLLLVLAIGITLFSLRSHSAWWPFSSGDDNTTAQSDSGAVAEIGWSDLIPDDFVQPENPFLSMSQEEIDKLMDGSDESNAEIARLQEAFNYAPVVSELDGKRVKIPAYVTPLEYNEESLINEFLLVPYVGACIHVPPPPANQIVYVDSPEALKIPSMYDPVWAIGTIRTETIESDLAESGYRLDVEEILPYSE
ncbi:MAG: DUF3299 domain-containing protein [Gammaproteobacteria bacterium]|nr:DUF3299 domain-containing protein [Gammaproteobacteria bacterium]